MSAEDLARWQARWQERPPALVGSSGGDPPEPFLVEHLARLRPGTVLDVASGDGRNARFLARQGFRVTALDIAPAALARLADTAEGLEIATRCADLDDPQALAGLAPFDDLVIIRYRPSPAQWHPLLTHLRPAGILLLCSFGLAQAERKGFRRDFCLVRETIEAEIGDRADLLHWHSFEHHGDALEGSLWRRA